MHRPRACRGPGCHLAWANGSKVDSLEAEELVLSLLRWALAEDAPLHPPARSTRRLLVRTKAYLESQFAQPIHLAYVGRAVGASPAYLTYLFRRVEGVPLHRYLTQLRFARALVELPHTDDLTALALDVGFSSHSHFSASFQRAFRMTPTEFRGCRAVGCVRQSSRRARRAAWRHSCSSSSPPSSPICGYSSQTPFTERCFTPRFDQSQTPSGKMASSRAFCAALKPTA